MPRKFPFSVHQDRHILSPSALQRGVGINVQHLEIEVQLGVQCLQHPEHVVAQAAVGAAVKSESYRLLSHDPLRREW